MRIDFETWFKQQDFYTNLRFTLGDRIFDFDNSINAYRSMHVQIAWSTWQYLHEYLQTGECVCECGECDEE